MEVVAGEGLEAHSRVPGMVEEVARATGDDLGHEREQQKLLSDLDREIEELETSLHEVNSQLKQASLRKEKKHQCLSP